MRLHPDGKWTPTLIGWLAITALLLAPDAGPDLHAAEAGKLKIGGTGGAAGTMGQLVEAFELRHPGVSMSLIQGLGTRGGINAVIKGALDIGLSGRPLKPEELAQGLREVEYARTPFVFVAHGDGAWADLTHDAIARIYRGDLKSWPDGTPIRPVLRQEGDVDTFVLRGISPTISDAVTQALARPGMAMAMDDQENCDLLERIDGSFGTASLTQIVSEKRALTVLPVNGITPDVNAVASGRYPHFKRYHLVTGPHSPPLAQEFIAFVRSPAGGEILARTGNLVAGTR